MSSDAQPGAPSAPVEPVPPPSPQDAAVTAGDVSAFRASKRSAKATDAPAPAHPDSPPAPPVEQVASTDAPPPAPASEPGLREPKPKKGADERVQELLAERAQLRRELEEVRRQPKPEPAAAVPSVPVETFPEFSQYVISHPEATFEQYLDARTDFRVGQQRKADEITQREARQRADSAKVQKAWQEKVTKARQTHEDFDDVALQRPTDIPPGSAIDAWILDSPDGAEVLYHLQSHPDEVAHLLTLTPMGQVRALVKLEQSLSVPPPKTLSDAPKPPTTLGTKPAEPANPIDAAVIGNDVAAFRAARLRERMAATRG